MPDPSLVCIGNVTVDDVVNLVVGDEAVPALGGDAIYASLAARLHLDRVSMLAPFGNDSPPEGRRLPAAAGVTVVETEPRDVATIHNRVTYARDGSRTWQLLSGDADFEALSVHPGDVGPETLAADGLLVLAMTLRSQCALVPWLRQNSAARVYLDLQEDYLEGNTAAILAMAARCHVFLPSEVEALALAGTSDPAEAAARFLDLGPDVVVVKRAERGCLVATRSLGVVEVATQPATPVDSTGAGDAFCGAFAAVHLRTSDPVEAALAGGAAARIAISSYGVDAIALAAATKATVSHE